MIDKPPIAPIQAWLLQQKRCVGCGRELTFFRKEKVNGHYLVTCSCRRAFVFSPKENTFRRAYLEDLRV